MYSIDFLGVKKGLSQLQESIEFMLVKIQSLSALLLILFVVVVAALWLWLSLLLSTLSLLGLVAVNAIRLLALVWEPNQPHCSFCGAAVLAGPGDGVADTPVSQPAGITAIVALKLPGGIHVAHLGNLCVII